MPATGPSRRWPQSSITRATSTVSLPASVAPAVAACSGCAHRTWPAKPTGSSTSVWVGRPGPPTSRRQACPASGCCQSTAAPTAARGPRRLSATSCTGQSARHSRRRQAITAPAPAAGRGHCAFAPSAASGTVHRASDGARARSTACGVIPGSGCDPPRAFAPSRLSPASDEQAARQATASSPRAERHASRPPAPGQRPPDTACAWLWRVGNGGTKTPGWRVHAAASGRHGTPRNACWPVPAERCPAPGRIPTAVKCSQKQRGATGLPLSSPRGGARARPPEPARTYWSWVKSIWPSIW
jgi:hypothetical protein